MYLDGINGLKVRHVDRGHGGHGEHIYICICYVSDHTVNVDIFMPLNFCASNLRFNFAWFNFCAHAI